MECEFRNFAARRKIEECRSAVPVWIMPLARVVESFDFGAPRFDVVIIDEANSATVFRTTDKSNLCVKMPHQKQFQEETSVWWSAEQPTTPLDAELNEVASNDSLAAVEAPRPGPATRVQIAAAVVLALKTNGKPMTAQDILSVLHKHGRFRHLRRRDVNSVLYNEIKEANLAEVDARYRWKYTGTN